jgi:hypothetical protein
MKSLEDIYLIAKLCQIASTSQARRATTYNSHTVAIRLYFEALNLCRVLQGPITNEALELTDGNSLTLDAEDT